MLNVLCLLGEWEEVSSGVCIEFVVFVRCRPRDWGVKPEDKSVLTLYKRNCGTLSIYLSMHLKYLSTISWPSIDQLKFHLAIAIPLIQKIKTFIDLLHLARFTKHDLIIADVIRDWYLLQQLINILVIFLLILIGFRLILCDFFSYPYLLVVKRHDNLCFPC